MNCVPSSREDIIELHLPLVEKLVDCARRRRDVRGVERDDMVSEGYIALIHGVDTFDATRGIERITYLTHKIVFALLNFLKVERRATGTMLSLEDLAENNHPPAPDWFPAFESRAAVEGAIRELPENLREPLRLHLQNEYSKAETARVLNVSPRHARRLIEQGLNALRQALCARP